MILKAAKKKGHYHIIYLMPDETGVTSRDSGHEHAIYREVNTETQIDEQGQETQVEVPGALVVETVNKHTHEITDVEIAPKEEPQLSDEDELAEAHALYTEAKDIHSDAYEAAEDSECYYMGDQWKSADRAALKAENRACITINEIKPKLDMLSGNQRQNRTDISVLPVEQGDAETSDIYNMRIKNICQMNNYDHEETKTFEDMSRVGIGFMRVNIIASDSGIGEVEVENRYWKFGGVGQHKKLDGSDAEYAYIEDFVSKASLKELYPDKADEIEADFDYIKSQPNKTPVSNTNRYTGKGKQISPSYLTDINADLVNIAKQEYRLIEVQRKVYRRSPVLFNARDNFYMNIDGMSKTDISKAERIEELSKINHVSSKIQLTVFAGNVLLAKEKSLFTEINIVPFYANKIENYFWGKVHEAKGPQEELNKRHSQAIDIINKMASYGIGVTSEAFESPKDYTDFVNNRNKPGFVAKFAPGFKENIHEFTGVRYPSEVVASSQLSSEKINTIMNIFPEMLGGPGKAESGIAMAHKQRQGLVGNEYLFDNFSLSKRRIGKLIVEGIQIVDSPEKLLRIAENQNNKTLANSDSTELYPQIGMDKKIQLTIDYGLITQQDAQAIMQQLQQGQPLDPEVQKTLDSMQQVADQIQKARLLGMLDNFELTDYDLVITESAYSPTTRLSNYMILQDLFRGNPNAPIQEMINLVPFLDQKTKDSLISGIQAQAQASQEQEKMKYDTEIQKSVIAQQGKQQQQTGVP